MNVKTKTIGATLIVLLAMQSIAYAGRLSGEARDVEFRTKPDVSVRSEMATAKPDRKPCSETMTNCDAVKGGACTTSCPQQMVSRDQAGCQEKMAAPAPQQPTIQVGSSEAKGVRDPVFHHGGRLGN